MRRTKHIIRRMLSLEPQSDDTLAPAVPPFSCGTCGKSYSDASTAISCCA